MKEENSNMAREFKNNLFVRNCGSLILSTKRFFMSKSSFSQFTDNVTLTPPLSLWKPQECISRTQYRNWTWSIHICRKRQVYM